MIILNLLLLAAAQSHVSSPYPLPNPKPGTVHLGAKPPRDFEEVPQPVQYDGDWAPPPGREPDPEPDATTPVTRPMPWLKDIPVVVAPAPRYVDEVPAKDPGVGAGSSNGMSQKEITAQVEQTLADRAKNERSGSENDNERSEPAPRLPAPTGTAGAGSVTGSTATASYSTTPGY